MESKKEKLVRLGARVLPSQMKKIKDVAKKLKIGEGEALRVMIDAFTISKK